MPRGDNPGVAHNADASIRAEQRGHERQQLLLHTVFRAYFLVLADMGIVVGSPADLEYRALPALRHVFAGFHEPPPAMERSRPFDELELHSVWYVKSALGLCPECGAPKTDIVRYTVQLGDGIERERLACPYRHDADHEHTDAEIRKGVSRIRRDIGAPRKRQRPGAEQAESATPSGRDVFQEDITYWQWIWHDLG